MERRRFSSDFNSELLRPMTIQSENIVGEPEVLRAVDFLEVAHFPGDFVGGARVEGIAEDRLGAPIAAERTPTAGDQVQRKRPVSCRPSLPIFSDIDEVARGERKAGKWARRRRPLPLEDLFGAHALHGSHAGHLKTAATITNCFD